MTVNDSHLGLEERLCYHFRHIISDILRLPQYADVTGPSPRHISQSITAQNVHTRKSPANLWESPHIWNVFSVSYSCLPR